MARDFFNQSFDPARTGYYGSFIPTNDWASAYLFTDGAGPAQLDVGFQLVHNGNDQPRLPIRRLVWVGLQLRRARQRAATGTRYNMAAAVEQDFQLACIPVFQFAIFYTMDLEINPGAPMKVTGKVHSNGNLYSAPPSTLEFAESVDAAGRIYTNRAPYDPTGGGGNAPTYDIPPVPGSSSLTLPISTNNSPSVVKRITEPPPGARTPTHR